MKKLFSKIASVTLAVVMSASVLTVAPLTASAATHKSGDYEYAVINNGEARIVGYSGNATNLIIPSEIDNLPVTAFGQKAFYGNTTITSITIPKTITQGATYCFANTKIKTAKIENGAKTVPLALFYGCTTLENINIPVTVTSIENEAFRFCASLKSVELPINLTSLGHRAFNSTGLTEITIPDTVVDGGLDCFAQTNVKTAAIENGAEVVADNLFNGCTTLEKVTIPNTVTSIENQAFRNCTSLKSIKLPANLTTIGHYAFESSSLTGEITIPKTLVDAGVECFANTQITSAGIERGAKTVANNLFHGCTTLKNVTIPDTVTTIEDEAFRGCKSLKNINLPAGLLYIEAFAFEETGLTEITIPKTVTKINTRAVGFKNGKKIDSFVIKGYAGTKAQEYADKNEITFVALSEPKPVGIIGDVNQDGVLDINDATYLQMHLAGYRNADGSAFIDTNNANMFMIADTNKDSVIDVADVTRIQMMLAYLV